MSHNLHKLNINCCLVKENEKMEDRLNHPPLPVNKPKKIYKRRVSMSDL